MIQYDLMSSLVHRTLNLVLQEILPRFNPQQINAFDLS